MRKSSLCMLLFLLLPSLTCLKAQTNFPEHIYFRTNTETFNSEYYLLLNEGKIWYKKRKTGHKWHILGKTGLPEGKSLKNHSTPDSIIGISADGIHLIALSSKGVFYRATNLQNDISQIINWKDSWGWPAAKGPGLRQLNNCLAWSVSDSHPSNIKFYLDGNNRKHSVGFGVAHTYALGNNGRTLHFNDWWLPADWSRETALPNQGLFKAVNLSASGSAIIIINSTGEIYTRYYDFDISGENPLYTYTFVNSNPEKHVRKLPLPDWKKQPPIENGLITLKITIYQVGKGHKTRMLRVEGQQNGESGYFYKMINDSAWEFQKTGHIINRPFLLPDKSAKKIEPFRINYEFTGILKKNDTKTSLNIVLNDFNFIGSPCKINILYNGKKLKISNKELVLFFHYRHTLVKRKRSVGYWENGDFANIRGAIVIPDEYRKEIEKLENEDFKLLLKNIFGTMNVINLHGTASLKGIKMDELSFWDLFRAPKDEKAFNSRYLLNLERKFN